MGKNKKIGFDLKTHIRDKKGKVVREDAYRLAIKNGVYEFERPKFSGNWYAADGSLIRSEKKSKEILQAPQAPEADKEALLKRIAELEAQNESLLAKDAEAEKAVDTALDEIPPAADLDNSEELALMESAQAVTPAQEQAKQGYKIPKFLGGNNG